MDPVMLRADNLEQLNYSAVNDTKHTRWTTPFFLFISCLVAGVIFTLYSIFSFDFTKSTIIVDHLNLIHYPKWTEEHKSQAFEAFKKQHNRVYSSADEEEMRFKIFKKNLHNVYYYNHVEPRKFTTQVNHFADFTSRDKVLRMGYNPTKNITGIELKTKYPITDEQLNDEYPTNLNYADTCKMPVFDQGSCSSCWAFAATGAVEGALCRQRGITDEILSVQELVDCDKTDGGCNGGTLYYSLLFAETYGLNDEQDYQYIGHESDTCNMNEVSVHKFIESIDFLMGESEQVYISYLNLKGPFAIALYVNDEFFLYNSGIFDGCENSPPNHAVTLYGYGVEDEIPFWIIKNSWGPGWGENGYIRLIRSTETQSDPCTIRAYGMGVTLLSDETNNTDTHE